MRSRHHVLLCLLLTLLLVACGGTTTPAAPTEPPSEPPAQTEPTEAPAPEEEPTEVPEPTEEPMEEPTEEPEEEPTEEPAEEPTETPEEEPTEEAGSGEGSAMAGATECEVDLTGEEITLYHFGDLSGSYAFITQPLIAGLDDAVAWLNDNGGICGATLAQEFSDTAGQQEETQAVYDRYSSLDEKPLMFVLYASADIELLSAQIVEDEIPVISAGVSTTALYGEDGQSPGWAYGTVPIYADQFGLFCEWVAANWEGEGEPKVGHLNWEGAFGRATDTPESQAYCAEQGVEVVGAEYFMPGTPDVTAQIQSLQAAGANIIYTTALASGPAQVLKDVVALGESENLMVAGVNWAMDLATIGLAQAAANGMVGHVPYLWWDDMDHPAIQLITEQWVANERPIETRNVAYLQAWAAADLYRELITRAVNETGSLDDVDGAAINAQLEQLQYSVMDGFMEVDFTDGQRAPTMSRLSEVTFNAEGRPVFVPLSDMMETPDLRPGGADVP